MPRPVRLAAVLASVALVAGTLAATPARTSAAVGDGAVPDASHAYTLERAGEVVERRVIGTSVRGRDIVAYRFSPADVDTVTSALATLTTVVDRVLGRQPRTVPDRAPRRTRP